MSKVFWKEILAGFRKEIYFYEKKSCSAYNHSHALQSWIGMTGSLSY